MSAQAIFWLLGDRVPSTGERMQVERIPDQP